MNQELSSSKIWLLICRVYVDIVLNHMTGNHEDAVGVGRSTADTFRFDYPAVPFGPSDFNQPPCAIYNYGDANEVSGSLSS
jgi:alpha-amylase